MAGAWSGWGDWGVCSSSCGVGLQHRLRYCDAPTPLYGGPPCPGPALRTQVCNSADCPNETMAMAEAASSAECRCGCEMGAPGLLVVSSDFCEPPSVWTIRAPAGHRVAVRVLSSSLSRLDVVKVRDGERGDGRLLLSVPQSRLREARSSSEWVRVEHEVLAAAEADRGQRQRRRLWSGAVVEVKFERLSTEEAERLGRLSLDLVQLGFLLLGLIITVLAVILTGLFMLQSGVGVKRSAGYVTCDAMCRHSCHSSPNKARDCLLTIFLTGLKRRRAKRLRQVLVSTFPRFYEIGPWWLLAHFILRVIAFSYTA